MAIRKRALIENIFTERRAQTEGETTSQRRRDLPTFSNQSNCINILQSFPAKRRGGRKKRRNFGDWCDKKIESSHGRATEWGEHRMNLIRHKQNRILHLITHKISQSWEFMLYFYTSTPSSRHDTLNRWTLKRENIRKIIWHFLLIKPLIFYKQRKNSNRDWNEVHEQTK